MFQVSRSVLTNTRSYVEWLEGERKILSLGLQEACRRLIAAKVWPSESLPRTGRLLSTHDMLVTLGVAPDSKDRNLERESLGRGGSDQLRRTSPLMTRNAPGKNAVASNSYTSTYAPGSANHQETFRPHTTNIVQPPPQSTATVLASLLNDTNLTRHSWPDAALMIPHGSQAFLPRQDGYSWRHTTDAYQDVSGPSSLPARSFALPSGAQISHRHSYVPQHGLGNLSGVLETAPNEHDESPPDGEGDRSEYIRIPF